MQGLAPGSPTFSESNQADVRKRPAGGVQKPGKVNFAQKPKQTLGVSDEFGASPGSRDLKAWELTTVYGLCRLAVLYGQAVSFKTCFKDYVRALLTSACCLTGFTAKNETFVGEI